MKTLLFITMILTIGIPALSQKRLAQTKTKAEVLNEKYCSGLFNTAHADYFDLLDDQNASSATSYLNVLDWLQGRVAGLRIYTTKYSVRIPFIRNQRANVFVDEMPVSYDYLNMLPVTDIAMIKIIKGPFSAGWSTGGGAVAVYTIRGEEEEEIPSESR